MLKKSQNGYFFTIVLLFLYILCQKIVVVRKKTYLCSVIVNLTISASLTIDFMFE